MKLRIFWILFFLCAIAPYQAFAADILTFPILELGGCGSRVECREYCADQSNERACKSFAQRLGIYTGAEGPLPGPAGCATATECREYCDISTHRKECAGALPSGERSSKANAYADVVETFDRGPGGCASEKECIEYCDAEDHARECYDFAIASGFASERDAHIADLMRLGGPGGCSSAVSCIRYCADMFRVSECVQFAAAHDLISKDRGMYLSTTLRGYIGGCAGLEDCRNFCFAYPRECVALHTVEARDVREGALFAAPFLRWLPFIGR